VFEEVLKEIVSKRFGLQMFQSKQSILKKDKRKMGCNIYIFGRSRVILCYLHTFPWQIAQDNSGTAICGRFKD
jgi:hypothetical protein